ncbi:MAG: FAD-dependent oxidoreductase [Armatimonadota bacterium]|nr:MAG: FAD-dependent oxidoreductase [Armatimonadota bacterium]
MAGVRAAEAIRQREKRGDITIVGDEQDGFYYRPQLADFAAGKASEKAMRAKPDDFYASNKIKVMLGKKASAVNAAAHRVELDDGTSVAYDRLLIATGASPRKAEVSGADLQGVHYLQTLADARALQAAAREAKQAVIAGENSIGLEIARALLDLGVQVSYLVRGERFWPEMLDADAGQLVEQHLEGRGIRLLRNHDLQAIAGSDGKVEKVVATGDEAIPCDLVALSLGLVPNTDAAQAAGIETDRGVLVDDKLATSAEDVYAAGDVTQAPDATTGEKVQSFGWLKAWRQGQAAGENMAGGGASVGDAISTLQVQILDVDFLAMGQSNPPPGVGLRKESAVFPDVGVYKALVRRNGTVVGAAFLGNVAEAAVIEKLIRSQGDISQLDPAIHKQMFDEFSLRSVLVGVLCPVCKLAVPLPDGAKEGDVVTCPVCGVELRLERMPNGLLGGRVAS